VTLLLTNLMVVVVCHLLEDNNTPSVFPLAEVRSIHPFGRYDTTLVIATLFVLRLNIPRDWFNSSGV